MGTVQRGRSGEEATLSDTDVQTQRSPISLDLGTGGRADTALLVLRLAAGVVLGYHGWIKLPAVTGFAVFFESLGIPAPEFMAYAVTYLEFLGGIALIVGLATRYVATLFAVEMVFTNVLVKFDMGLIASEGGVGAELDILILAIAVSLALLGGGRWSADGLIAGRRPSG